MTEYINDETSSKSFLVSPYWIGKIFQSLAHERIKEKNWTRCDTM